MTIYMKDLHAAEKQSWLQASIAPRPIALASTINREGQVNLSPFSFFNLFSSEPPVVIFSPSLRVRDGSRKHTLMNIEEIPEVAIAIVDHAIVHQTNHASAEFDHGVNEFKEAGFTEMPSACIRPPYVKEARVNLECKVIEIKPLGKKGGAGNLIICEVLAMHVDEGLIGIDNKICPVRFEQVARLGGDWYCRVNEASLFRLSKPVSNKI